MKLNTFLAVILATACIGVGVLLDADASSDGPVLYDVECSDHECIRFNPRTGESWILACPGAPKGCEWDPIEVREP